MDIIEYLHDDDGVALVSLARASGIPLVRLRRIAADPRQPVRYMTARRLAAASGGAITMEAMARRGAMRGEDLYAGPLGQIIADVGSRGATIAERLARAGITDEHMRDTLLRGRVPSPERMRRYREAFGPRVRQRDFREHARWRSGA